MIPCRLRISVSRLLKDLEPGTPSHVAYSLATPDQPCSASLRFGILATIVIFGHNLPLFGHHFSLSWSQIYHNWLHCWAYCSHPQVPFDQVPFPASEEGNNSVFCSRSSPARVAQSRLFRISLIHKSLTGTYDKDRLFYFVCLKWYRSLSLE